MNSNSPDMNSESPERIGTDKETQTIGVFNIADLNKTEAEKELETQTSIEIKKWLKISFYISALLLLLGFWKRYFLYLAPLPPLIAFLSVKTKHIVSKFEQKHPEN